MKKSTVRFIRSIVIEQTGPELQITVTGNGFLYPRIVLLCKDLCGCHYAALVAIVRRQQ